MKHRAICIILSVLLLLSLAACGGADSGHTVYIRDTSGYEDLQAEFLSTEGDAARTVGLKKVADDEGGAVYSCSADPAQYDRMIVHYGDNSTDRLAFNEYVSGWELDEYRFMPYLYEGDNTEPAYERVSFPYESRTKDILIWVPEDYDNTAEQPYSVLYMTDGQNLFKRAATSTGSWGVAESARALMAQSDNRLIIVGIENADGFRDSELTPDIGEVLSEDYENGRGEYFSDFVLDTVMPYVEERYNIYTDRKHTGICGSSSGGIESFYIAMEHPDRFGAVGALSPAFTLYSNDTWREYLSEKDFSAGYPFVYLYCGNGSSDTLEQVLCADTITMPDNLKAVGYPEEQVILKVYNDGLHKEMYWRAVFPEFLKYMFP